MKNGKWLVLSFIVVLGYIACKKNNSVSQPVTNSLDATKTSSIARGEPVTFTYHNSSTSDTVKWSVTPSDSVVVRNYGDSASFIFYIPGTYQVRAQSGSGYAGISVIIDTVLYKDSTNLNHDSTGHNGDTTALLPLTGDQINLTVSKIDSGSFSGLVFAASTSNTYNCLNNYLAIEYGTSGTTDNIKFDGVNIPGASLCSAGKTQSTGSAFIYPIADGTYNLNIQLNGKTYTGTYTKTGQSYVFNWGYTSGVTISPQSLN